MLTFVTAFRKFKVDPFGLIQSSALYSWNRQKISVLAPDNEIGLHDHCPGVSFLKGVRTGRDLGFSTSAVVLPDLLSSAIEASETLLVGLISSDVLITPDFMKSVEDIINLHGYETFLTSTRYSISLQFPVNSEETYEKAMGLPRSNHGSPDLFITSKFQWRKMLKEMPEFIHGRSYWDSWILLYGKLHFSKHVDCTNTIPVIHCSHDGRYRKLQGDAGNEHNKVLTISKSKWGDRK